MITLDLPPPLSVNRARRIDWAAKNKRNDWIALADALVIQAGQHKQERITGPYEIQVFISRESRIDLDNGLKTLIDYVVRLELVTDDGPRFLKKITVEFGEAPQGARIIIEPWDDMWERPFHRPELL